jgi:alanine dehydrogenase
MVSGNFLRFFGTFYVGKVKLLLQAFELVAVRTQQVFVITNTVVCHGAQRPQRLSLPSSRSILNGPVLFDLALDQTAMPEPGVA